MLLRGWNVSDLFYHFKSAIFSKIWYNARKGVRVRKFQFFLLVEAILLSLALMTILSESLYSFLLLLVVMLLALRFYNQGSQNNFLLTASLLLLFLVVMLNPFVIMAILLGIVYTVINYFAQVKSKNRYALIQFREDDLAVCPKPNQWIGAQAPLLTDAYAFNDINIVRLSGTDSIDLGKVILSGRDNVIMIRKIYGPISIHVPIDVAVSLNVSAIYGTVHFLDFPDYDLRNESLKLEEPTYAQAHRSVKVVVSTIAGKVEVIRR